MKTDLAFPHWIKDGLCGTCDNPDAFFPHGSTTEPRNSEAVKICRECPVWKQCREWALESGEPHGTWGGLTSNQRARIRNRRAKA